jgi:hypothetical protein
MSVAADTFLLSRNRAKAVFSGSNIPALQRLSHNKKTERNINTNLEETFKREGGRGRKEKRNVERKN